MDVPDKDVKAGYISGKGVPILVYPFFPSPGDCSGSAGRFFLGMKIQGMKKGGKTAFFCFSAAW